MAGVGAGLGILSTINPQPSTHLNYNPKIVLAVWRSCGLPAAEAEFRFHPTRKWRFDFAFPNYPTGWRDKEGNMAVQSGPGGGLAIEVQGGIWTQGRHTRGAGLVKEHEKLNAAAGLGWRVLFCTPQQVATVQFAQTIKAALGRR